MAGLSTEVATSAFVGREGKKVLEYPAVVDQRSSPFREVDREKIPRSICYLLEKAGLEPPNVYAMFPADFPNFKCFLQPRMMFKNTFLRSEALSTCNRASCDAFGSPAAWGPEEVARATIFIDWRGIWHGRISGAHQDPFR